MCSRSKFSSLFAFIGVSIAAATGILVSSRSASAQPAIQVLHTFVGGGARQPVASQIQAADGNFYGTTASGGAFGGGTVFKITPGGTATILCNFFGSAYDDENTPYAALVQGTDGYFYGTASGGLSAHGTVFRMDPERGCLVMHWFTGGLADGAAPTAALIQASDGNFYGTTSLGGAYDVGTVFRITPRGTVTVLHAFSGSPSDGSSPRTALIQATDGDFYGTTYDGGSSNAGTVFRMTLAGSVTLLHSFTNSEGFSPSAGLIQAPDGDFYGTTESGGPSGSGTVFKITQAGTFTLLHAFSLTDGAGPRAALIQATDGNFYGTTFGGGASGAGTAFQMTPGGIVTILHTFIGGTTDGESPRAALIQATDGNFYGTTSSGGDFNGGTAFKMDPAGTVSFVSLGGTTDGASPFAALCQASDGNFYGTTNGGGINGFGTVFKMTPAGTVTILHSFAAGAADGSRPSAALIQAADGNFYGTTVGGGASDLGTVFKMTSAGTVTLLHSFTGEGTDGVHPRSTLVQAADGNFYGTTLLGGVSSAGTVFKMTPAGTVTILHSFAGGAADGRHPYAGLIQATDGNFYGTTSDGGTSSAGTVFRMTPSGTVTILHSFATVPDGGYPYPYAALIQATDGNFYGTTSYGTTFKMTPSGAFTLLHIFSVVEGTYIQAPLIQGSDGNFYGTASSGGTHGASGRGTVFKMTPAGTISVLHNFTGGMTDGASPYAALVQVTDGSFYGTTLESGASDWGIVFRLPVAPTITTQPQSHTTAPGQAITLSVAASGRTPLSYQWYIGTSGTTTSPISGAISNSYMTPPLTSTTSYWVRVSNSDGTADSNTATLTVVTPPAITTQPLSQTIASRQVATLIVAATGTLPLNYQWYAGTSGATTSPIGGATSSSYATPALTSTTSYWVRVSNSAGAADSTTATVTVVTPKRVLTDADGDGKADLTIFRPSDGTWFTRNSTTGYTTNSVRQWGLTQDVPVPGDYDGDGQMDLAVYRPSNAGWYIRQSSTNAMATYTLGIIGLVGDLPVPGDYDGDGKTDPAVYHRSTGVWSILTSSTNYATPVTFQFGLSGDIPVPSDYDGDGKADLAVYRPSTGTWYVLTSSSGSTTSFSFQWGLSGDVPVPGDYDGDGITDLAVYRPADGVWYIRQSTTGFTTSVSFQWGLSTDVPVPSDYDGDGKTDLAVYRPSTGMWFIRQSTTGYATSMSFQWGLSDDIPAPNAPIANAMAASGGSPLATLVQASDFDGDRKADVTVFRPSNGTWFNLKSGANYTTAASPQFGQAGDVPVPGDYDGDGKTDVAVFRPSSGTWYILKSSDSTVSVQQWGVSGDVPVPGDYDGDGRTDLAVYRPSAGTWYILKSTGSTFVSYAWGLASDTPVAGDYDGDGVSDPAVWRPSTGEWFILKSSTNFATSLQFQWGTSGDIAVPGDFDGDGKTDLGVYRPSSGTWYVSQSPTGSSPTSLIKQFGQTGDIPVAGDYDGDGKTDIAVFRSSTGTWFLLLSGSNYTSSASYQWGQTGDIPILKRP